MSGQQVSGWWKTKEYSCEIPQCACETEDREGQHGGLVAKGSMAPNLQSNVYAHTKQEGQHRRSVRCKFFGYKEQRSATFSVKRDLQPLS